MDCFYIITNKLKDKDYAITSQIEQYIQSSGKKCFLSEKDSEGHIIPGTVPKEAECGLVLGGDGTLIPCGQRSWRAKPSAAWDQSWNARISYRCGSGRF